MKLLIDTNIFLDVLFMRPGLADGSQKLLYSLRPNNDQAFVNASSLKDIFYFANKGYKNKEKAIELIQTIYSCVSKIIDCSANDAINALYEDGDYEDNMLRQSALRTFCDAIITRNTKDFAKKDIPCLTPEEYLKIRK